MPRYYDWPAIFSRQTGTNGEICMVLGARSIGKTYGLRKQCVKDFIKDGSRFVEIVRTESELKGSDSVQSTYFDKFDENNEFPEWQFKTEGKRAYAARRVEDGMKPEWQLIGYFIALTTFQRQKKVTFAKVKRFIFDEAIMDRRDKHHRYLPDEYGLLASVISTVAREQPEETHNIKLYLLGNAVDITCPYFEELGIGKDGELPDYGLHWYRDKNVLFDNVKPWDNDERRESTFVGRMLKDHKRESDAAFSNSFAINNAFIEGKPSSARFNYAIAFKHELFGIWVDMRQGLVYVSRKVPKDAITISLTLIDNSIDYHAVKRNNETVDRILSLYYANLIRYESIGVKEGFYNVLRFFGVR